MNDFRDGSAMAVARKRLIMIMGVQRSGTTALLDSLSAAPGVTAREESADDEIYHDFFLRPEAETRGILNRLPGTVLLKPVRESEVRTPAEVAREFSGYDLRIIWLYRDPVNVFDSYVRKGWRTSDIWSATNFALHWSRRNAAAIADAREMGQRLLVVRYEDLVCDPRTLVQCTEALGLRAALPFGADSSLGRKRQPEEHVHAIDTFTTAVRQQLDTLRLKVSPGDTLVSTEPSIASRRPVHSREYRDAVAAGEALIPHARLLARGPLWRDSESSTYVSVGYEVSRAVLALSRPSHPVPSLAARQGAGPDWGGLGAYFTDRRGDITARLRDVASRWSCGLPAERVCDLMLHMDTYAADCVSAWLDVPRALSATLRAEARSVLVAAASGAAGPIRVRTEDEFVDHGVVADLVARGLLARDDVTAFLWDTAMRLFFAPLLVCNSLVAIARHREQLLRGHVSPSSIPEILAEAARLVPTWFAVRRTMIASLSVGEVAIPQGAIVEVFLATANCDPSSFEDPGEWRIRDGGPRPLLSDSDAADFTSLTEDPPWGCRHLLFDISAMALERLLSGPCPVTFALPPRTEIFRLPGGDALQVLQALQVKFGPPAP